MFLFLSNSANLQIDRDPPGVLISSDPDGYPGGEVFMQTQNFRVGDKAVYPAHGVAEILGIESKEISGAKQTFYILKLLDTGMRIMVPTNNVESVGLRGVITSSEADEVYAILRSKEISVEGQTWNRRHREYME